MRNYLEFGTQAIIDVLLSHPVLLRHFNFETIANLRS